MTTRYKDDVQKLYEYWCEIKAPTHLGESGRILESYPDDFNDPQIVNRISDFAYPCEMPRDTDSILTFSFVLTTIDSKFRFGFCRHDPRAQTAMVVLTYLPWHDVFTKFLNVLGEVRATNDAEFRQFLREAYVAVPEPGACLKLHYRAGTMQHFFQRPAQFMLPSMPENNNLNMYYNFIEPKNMIAVFAAMLAERRIVFTSAHLDRLSACVQSANAFLYPMSWEHIFIPILPMKLRETLGATMPFLIGVPISVLENMTKEEVGDIVILNCDERYLESPFDDVKAMPAELVSHLKKHLSNSAEHIGNRVSRIFLGVLVQLIGGYRDGIKFPQGEKLSFDGELFLESKAPHVRAYLRQLMQSQLFQQFIDGRLKMLESGQGISDEFEMETIRYSEKMSKKGKNFLRNVKDKTNPAVKSAVQSVRQGSRGMKAAYKDLRSKLREKPTSLNNSSFGEMSVMSQSHHHDASGSSANSHGHPFVSQMHSAPNSPMKMPGDESSEAAPDLRPSHRSGSFETKKPILGAAMAAHQWTGDSVSLRSVPRQHPAPDNDDDSDSDSFKSLATAEDDDDDDRDHRFFDSPPAERSPPVPMARQSAPHRPPAPLPQALAALALAPLAPPHQRPPPKPPTTATSTQSSSIHSNHHPIPPMRQHHQQQQHLTGPSNSRHIAFSNHSARAGPHSTHQSTSSMPYNRFENDFVDASSPSSSSSLAAAAAAFGPDESFTSSASLSASSVLDVPSYSSSVWHNNSTERTTLGKQSKTPTSPNLITLDTSFEVEDLDPLNENAKELPPVPVRQSPMLALPFASSGLPSTTCAMGANSATGAYRPVYPMTMAGNKATAVGLGPMQQQQQQQQRRQQENDADFELLRKYGLDKFSLSSGGGGVGSAGRPGNQVAEASVPSTARQRHWTGFE